MTRSSLPVAAVTAAAAVLLLAACGGGSNGSDKIDASDSPTASATASATTASPTQAAGPGAPSFDLPSDIKVNFDGFDSSDPTKKAALKDATYAATAVVAFTAKTYTKEPAFFKRFWTGEHGAEFADSLISQGKGGSVVTGTFDYYKPVVKKLVTGNLSVQYCEDQRKAYGKDAKTGKVNVTTPSLADFNLWTLTMTKSSTGEWQAYDHTWQNGAKQCQIA
ncbi:hypothetical protein OG896_18660 [Streptomyces sp. NBC_00669]|uniref:hypothetical protein n=1 Tax=unclassified Streptomyces TaxID=2593676 RepID=UPI002E367420|nr:hypothetical protein [Streptomyces sp. NBC_00669]